MLWPGLMITEASAADNRTTALVKAVQRAIPSVVNIHSEKTSRDPQTAYGQPAARKINGMGTGIIIDERGYIVTNQHVVMDTDALRVTLKNGGTYRAELISFDPKHDLAIIKINAPGTLPVAPMGTSADIMLGETVIAIGNAFGYEHTITQGIVSALGRNVEVNEKQGYKNLIQTDASINPGNSGGPLLNLDGEVVGINVAIRAGAQRIGFAIPIDDARIRVAKLLDIQKLSNTWHGLVAKDVKTTTENMQLQVQTTMPNSPALEAGLKTGDIVVKVAEQPVHDQADWERALLGRNPGDKVELEILRDGHSTPLTLSLASNSRTSATAQRIVPAIKPAVIARANNADAPATEMTPDEERVWQVLGVRLGPAPSDKVQTVAPRFNGGLRVLEVRANSPAQLEKIYKGDILCGLHIWQTENINNVMYVLNHSDLSSFGPLRFYVIRDSQTLYGHLKVTPALTQKGAPDTAVEQQHAAVEKPN
ncbi:MAG: HtrA2 peptidase [Planctomycetaceae bacterium]|nr:HtrA2 peptidase [Planctomycetaceae bacterium]